MSRASQSGPGADALLDLVADFFVAPRFHRTPLVAVGFARGAVRPLAVDEGQRVRCPRRCGIKQRELLMVLRHANAVYQTIHLELPIADRAPAIPVHDRKGFPPVIASGIFRSPVSSQLPPMCYANRERTQARANAVLQPASLTRSSLICFFGDPR